MPADTNLVFSQNTVWSYLTDMRDGATVNFTTPRVSVPGGIPAGSAAVARMLIPAYTNRSPGSGVGAYTRPFITAVLQGAEGAASTEANWVDVASLRAIHPNRVIRPHVPVGSTGAGTTANPIFSNIAIARFGAAYTQYRLSVQVLGSFPDLSMVVGTLRIGQRLIDAELL